jgi:hypothetical protein
VLRPAQQLEQAQRERPAAGAQPARIRRTLAGTRAWCRGCSAVDDRAVRVGHRQLGLAQHERADIFRLAFEALLAWRTVRPTTSLPTGYRSSW